MADLLIEGLGKSYGDTEVLSDINLAVANGEFMVFVGPSGCGKSTLLRLICGLDAVSAGTIAVGGAIVNNVPSAKRGIAMVFQSYALYPHMTVAANMGYALRLAKTPREDIRRRVQAAAEILKIEELLSRKPRQLSGGQRQRVAIGRAIVREPEIFLFDEPLSNLDAALRVDMRMEFARLKERLGTTMIYVTHDQVEAMTLADRIVVMNAGRIEQVGTPLELYERPANRFVAGFIGSPKMTFLPAHADGEGISLPGGRLDHRASDAVAEIGVRPEHIALRPLSEATTPGERRDGRIEGRIAATEHLGSDTFAHVDVEGLERPVVVRLPGAKPIRAGEAVELSFDHAQVYAFDGDGRALPCEAPEAKAA
ncbi:MAG: ABC transporter ATP-binding protein [Pseudomonadota bacterium]